MIPGTRLHGARAVSLAYIWLLVAVMVNQGLHSVGLPAVTTSTATPYDPLGTAAVAVLGISSVAVLLWVPSRTAIPDAVWWLALAASGIFLAAYLSALLGGYGSSPSTLVGGAASAAVLIGGSTLSSRDLRRLLIWGGGVFAWGSLLIGVLTVGGLSGVTGVDSGERYSDWLRVLGVPVSAPEFGVLVGLGSGRQALAGTMAMLLLMQCVVLATDSPGATIREWLIGPVGSAAALAWTFSRTGFLALLIAVAIQALPWRRWSGRPLVTLTFVGLVLISILPLAALSNYRAGNPSGTWEWRLELWHQSLESLSTSWIFGLSAATPPPLGALHAHNLILEVLTVGGVLALIAYAYFLWRATDVAVTALPSCRAALAALSIFVVLGQTEMPLSFRAPGITQRWFILLVVLSATAALLASSRHAASTMEPESTTGDPR